MGLVGPSAQGERVQKFVHEVIGSAEPQGWDTQLHDEIVIQFSRSRVWRSWVSENENMDVLTHVEVNAGTLESSLNTGIAFRYGRRLKDSYSTTLLNNSRTSNPAALDGGWYVYGGVQIEYTFNQIVADGNTFRDSRKIDYKREAIGLTAGIAYSWNDYSLTLGVADINILQGGESEKSLEETTRFGTLTFAWSR